MFSFHDLRHIASKFSPPAGPRALERAPGPPADLARALRALAGDYSRRALCLGIKSDYVRKHKKKFKFEFARYRIFENLH